MTTALCIVAWFAIMYGLNKAQPGEDLPWYIGIGGLILIGVVLA